MAELLADENMESIKIAVFKGKTKAYFLKRNEYGNTCLISALEKVTRYAEALNETYVDVSVRPRREKHLFNIEAFKEAWINACVHYKWTDGIPPAVYWFDDRLEIISYGGIPKGLTKEGFLSGETQPVNAELMKIFLQCDIVDQSGHGVPIIVREYGEKAYKFSESSITVTIPFDRTGFNVENTQENTQEKMLILIKSNPKITRKQIAKELLITEDSAKYHLDQLKKKGKITHLGSTKSGYWEIRE